MNLSERVREIIEQNIVSGRRFVALEAATQISAKTWQTWWSRGGKPSADMIQAIGQLYPHFAFWLVTGVTDEEHGHTNPKAAWPEKGERIRHREQASKLFSARIEISKYAGRDVPEQLLENERFLCKIRKAEEKLLSEMDELQT